MKRFGSVVKKYAVGYVVFGIVVVLFLTGTLFANHYVSVRYQTAIAELVSISQLETAVNDLNAGVNMAYLWLQEAGLESYEEKRQAVENLLQETRRQVEERFLREMADTNHTIETYMEKCDALKEKLEDYLLANREGGYDALEKQYEEQQEVYAYVVTGFQGVYSVRLNGLHELEQQMNSFQHRIMLLQFLCLGAVLTICFAYLIRIVREISGSIRIMMTGIAAIEKNVFEAEPIQISSNDEFEEFAGAFNEMVQIIQLQMREIEENASVKEQLARMEIENLKMFSDLQKSHLDFLQSRVNPHFLFNTLNMISSLARIENAEQSAELMEITASFLRYNLDNISKTVTLRQEMKNLKEYVAIQEYRYGGRYRYDFSVDEDCMDFQMPCMILQPLVENAVQHGIAMKLNGGCVWIRAYAVSSRIFLEVRDNGIGMTQQQIEEIYNDFYEKNGSTNHIGLRNIYRRLQLFYQSDVQFELNNMNPGLEITITLPWEGDRG